ncbi:MAG: ArsR/SmtB family transcription factor [Candidatus Thorarchaeota archaeon]|jgi:DNA-binding HxlR family transcriptional regulator
MSDDEVFDAISHPTRVELLKILASKPTRFADLKRKLRIDSSGLLDFHLKKMQDIITTNERGNYELNERGYAALQAVDVVSKYGWQRRSYILNVIVYVSFTIYFTVLQFQGIPFPLYLLVVGVLTAWIIFYSYWSLIKRKVKLRKEEP